LQTTEHSPARCIVKRSKCKTNMDDEVMASKSNNENREGDILQSSLRLWSEGTPAELQKQITAHIYRTTGKAIKPGEEGSICG